MKTLINNLVSIFNNGIIAGRIRKASVIKGINNDPGQIGYDRFPAISIDVASQKVVEMNGQTTQKRVYSVMLEFVINVLDIETALDDILDFVDECKKELENPINRNLLFDSHNWAINMTTFSWGSDNKFFRGTQVIVEFYELDDRMEDY